MEEEEEKSGKGKTLIKLFLMLFLLLVLIIGGFALGIYLRIFDTQAMNEKFSLYSWPIIGQYFVKPAPTQQDMENKPVEDVKPDTSDKDKQPKKKVTLSKKEIEAQTKEREAAEKKRVSKLARLYGNMKPEDAAADMDPLNDDVIVAILGRMEEDAAANVLSKFTPDRAARLTQLMYEGTQKNVLSPDDIQKMMDQQSGSGDNSGNGGTADAGTAGGTTGQTRTAGQ